MSSSPELQRDAPDLERSEEGASIDPPGLARPLITPTFTTKPGISEGGLQVNQCTPFGWKSTAVSRLSPGGGTAYRASPPSRARAMVIVAETPLGPELNAPLVQARSGDQQLRLFCLPFSVCR